ncbi:MULTISPECIES: DUF2243 domain-containing protein [Streptomyces]|uniref:DUF2243 domain-containing protein n=1 Tax=Streptomyces lichenis TaxID=2306967 RepID=A0ABT0IBN8_9ACTN|nr:DUF2243 domain-containing protein [Streptomyces lichenis]MCK8678707.1 DUF2243 domain-containing protein [Streptomyces lichenis]
MATTTGTAADTTGAARGLRLPGIVLGVGLGGFVDGILLHQLLQWHHMLTSTDTDRIGVRYYPADTVAGLEMNTVWDGIFHTVCWLAVLTGLAVLYARVTHHRRRVWTSPALWGWVLVGWGLFNLVEGVLDHHVLGIHHVYAGERQLWWDLGFLLLGAVLVAAGWTLQRRGRPFDPSAGGGSGGGPAAS